MDQTITSIEVQKKDSNRFSIFLDGEFAFGIHKDVLLESGIARGDRLTESQVETIKKREEVKKAKIKAVKLLSVRARSRKELDERLKRSGFSTGAIDETLRELERLDLVNDAEFAVLFARTKMAQKPQGKLALSLQLKKKGIEETAIENAIAKAYEGTNESEVAFSLANRKKQQFRNLEEQKAKKRLSDYLLRRGFRFDVVRDVLENWDHLELE
jgi:regulatory protein